MNRQIINIFKKLKEYWWCIITSFIFLGGLLGFLLKNTSKIKTNYKIDLNKNNQKINDGIKKDETNLIVSNVKTSSQVNNERHDENILIENINDAMEKESDEGLEEMVKYYEKLKKN